LIFTLMMMGASTFMVGCLPTYNQIGTLAPILLVILRLCQGFSASGEQAGANSMTLEHAPPNRRAFVTSFTLNGTQAGSILATAVFLPISRLPEDQLLSWGWRVPFWLSVAVVVLGWVIRRTLDETPAFLEEKEQQAVPKAPLPVLFRYYTPDIVRVVPGLPRVDGKHRLRRLCVVVRGQYDQARSDDDADRRHRGELRRSG